MLRGGVAVAQLFGGLHGIVKHVHQRIAGHALHAHETTRLLGHADDFVIHVDQQRCGIGANALDNGREVVFLSGQQRFQHMNGLCLSTFGIGGNSHGLLQRFLRCQS